jgi:hypothetical protein
MHDLYPPLGECATIFIDAVNAKARSRADKRESAGGERGGASFLSQG